MGWTSYYATKYYQNNKINRKGECDALFLEGLNRGYFEVLKSTMKGSTYYAAIKALKREEEREGERVVVDIPKEEQEVFGVVVLTSTKGDTFFYKILEETCGPSYTSCPLTILNLLSPTKNQYALEWRKKCRENTKKVSLSKLKIGTKIEVELLGQKVQLVKKAPQFQFKTPFWFNEATRQYVPKQYLKEFVVIE